MADDQAPSVGPGRLELLLTLGALAAFGSLSIAMYLPGLPLMTAEFGGAATGVQDTVAAFSLGLCLGQLVYGPASDRWGRRLPLLVGIGLYLAATVACIFATDLSALIAFRFIQGLGGCAGVVISRAIVRDRFTPRESAGVYSTLMLILGVAPILSPLAGGWVIAAFGWRAVFWVLLAFGIVLGAIVALRLGESTSATTRFAARAEHPFRSYWAILTDRQVAAFIACGGFVSAGTFIYMTLSPHLFIDGFGVSATNFGWFYGAGSLAILIGSQVNRLLLRRYTSHHLLIWSTRLNLVACLLMLASVARWPQLIPAFLIPLCLAFTMNGLSSPNAAAEAMGAAGWRAGAVSALMGFAQFGMGAVLAALAIRLIEGSGFEIAAMLSATSACAVVCLMFARRAPAEAPYNGLADS